MKRYIWLGDSKYGGSVYWDNKKEIVVRNANIKVSAKENKSNIKTYSLILMIFIMIRVIFSVYKDEIFNSAINSISIVIFTLFFTTVITLFIYKALYGESRDYIETTLEDAMYAIKSTGYLENTLIFMLVDKKFKYMLCTIIILGFCFGLSQILPNLSILQSVIRVPFMIFFLITPVYMVYLVNFKKDNRLKL